MVSYDSVSFKLHFTHRLERGDAGPFMANDLSVDLSSLPENIRQLVIIAAKLSSAHASGQRLTARGDETKAKEGKAPPSYLGDKLIKRVSSFSKTITSEAVVENPNSASEPT
jgi:hypothetical protein